MTTYPELNLVAPPVTKEGAKDLYKKAGMLISGAAATDHPEAAAAFIDFLVNSPEVGAIFGTNRGMPASETQLDGIELDKTAQQIIDYEESIADRVGDAPPVPVIGYGSVEAKFKALGQELGFGTITVDEAVDQLFAEIDVILSQIARIGAVWEGPSPRGLCHTLVLNDVQALTESKEIS